MTVTKLYAALDVSLNKTAICIMDYGGILVHEAEVATHPYAISQVLLGHQNRVERLGLEAGPMSEWLVDGLAEFGIEAMLMETRQAHKALSAMTVKTDRKDARGLAHLIRMGWFRPVHVMSALENSGRGWPRAGSDAGARHWAIANTLICTVHRHHFT
jgi:transposase